MSPAGSHLESHATQETTIRMAIRLVDETQTRLTNAERVWRDTVETIEKSKTSIRECEDLVKHAQQVLTMRKF